MPKLKEPTQMKIALEDDPEPLEVDEPLMMREVLPRLVPYCTSIFGGPDREDPRMHYCGSGTFVTAVASPSLLTAAHVWEQMRSHEWIFLTLDAASTNVGRRPLAIERQVMPLRFVSPRPPEGWRIEGPDIAIIGLPALHASRARLQKAFYDLDKRRADVLTSKVRDHDGLWAVLANNRYGAPGESQVCHDCIVHPYSQHPETCVGENGCNSEIRLYDQNTNQYVCNAMHLGCPYPRNCCGLIYDYPPIPCDEYCAGCDPRKVPKTAKRLDVEKNSRHGTPVPRGRADEQTVRLTRKNERSRGPQPQIDHGRRAQ
jgi:hypothetical protein